MARLHRQGADSNNASNMAAFGDMTVGDYANGMPTIRIGEFIRSFFRQLKWLIPLFLLGAIPAYLLTKDIKRDYKGEGRVLVQLGSEYVYSDVATNTPSQTMTITPEVIALNETAIMKNSEIIEQVIGQMISDPDVGEARFAKQAFAKINRARASGNAEALANARVDLHKMIDKSYIVSPQPKSSIIDVEYRHPDGDIAVKTTNAFIDAYLAYRRAIFVEGSSEVITEQRKMTEAELQKTEKALQKFLRRNGISDFDSERTGSTSRTENLRAELTALQGSLTEAEAALASAEQQLQELPEEINLYVDDRASQRVAQAELELKQLLAKYLPTSDPVKAKRTEIEQIKSLQRANNGNAVGGRRVGPNPVYQALVTRRNQLASTSDSLREKEYTVQSQLNNTDAKVRKFQNLSPEYNNLVRERNTLQQRLRGYTNKEQEALINQQQAEDSSENVHVISYATLPRKGRNMRKIIFAVFMLGWGFTLFMLALLRVFLDPSLYGASPGAERHSSRQSKGHSTGRRSYDTPAAPYIPEPVPATMPAAATAAVYAAPVSAPAFAEPAQIYNNQVYDGNGPQPYIPPGTNVAYDTAYGYTGGIPSSEQG